MQREIGEEQVVIDDDDVAFLRALVHQRDEAALELGHFWPVHRSRARVDLGPGGAGFGQRLDLGAIADFGGLLPLADDLEIGDLFQAGEHRLLFGVVDLLPAGVVVAALHVADLERPREVLLQKRNVLEEELFLQILGAGGNDDALAGEHRGNQVGQRLAGAGAGLDDQVPLVGERGFDGLRHLELARRGIRNWDATWKAFRRGQKNWRAVGGAGLSGHRDGLILTRRGQASWPVDLPVTTLRCK